MPTLNEDSREPLVSVSLVTGVAAALVALVVAFGLNLTEEQKTAILGLVAVAAPFIVAAVGRRKVFSQATVARLLAARRGDA